MNDKFEYEVLCTLDVGNSVDSVREVLESINKTMKNFGMKEQYGVSSNFSMTLSCNRELTNKELHRMKVVIGMAFIETLPQYDIRVESIRSKSSDKSYNATNATNEINAR